MKLTKRNYFSSKANKQFFSVSQYKAFETCPACAMAELNGNYERDESSALLVGSYIDSFFEGSLRAFKNHHPEIFKKDGSLKAEYLQAEDIISRVSKDKMFMDFMSGQKQVIMTGTIAGVPIKIKIDSLHEDKIVDLKVMRDMESIYVEDIGRVPFFEAWKYDLQGAVYQEIVRQNTGKKLPFYLAVATKEKYTNIEIIHIKQKMLDEALQHFEQNIQTYDAIKSGIIEPDRCEKCKYCRNSKVLTEVKESDEFYFE